MNFPSFGLHFLTALVLPRALSAALTVTAPRCDWAENPLGVDSAPPSLSWKLTSDIRDDHQTAYQVHVASSAARLAAGTIDRWDSGRVASADQLQVPYTGPALGSGEQVFWQVRVWDAAGQPSAWSAPASWTMGIVAPADWSAHWITDPDLNRHTRQKLGFSTPPVTDPATPQWLALDLGAEVAIDQINLHAVVHTVNERLGFPRWFKLELARAPDFADAVTVSDTTVNPINLWLRTQKIPVDQVTARYVRLTVPRLRMMDEASDGREFGRLTLSQIEVIADGRNVAVGAAVSASASLEDARWSAAAVVDGLGLPGANPRATATLRLRREFLVRPELRRAVLHITGLGHYTLALNGAAIAADSLLKPGWTDYTKTVLYDTYDVTAAVHVGAPNVLGLTLASGMYNVPEAAGRYTKFVGPPRPLVALAQLRLEYADGHTETLITDPHWKVAPGPVTFAHVYGGEDYDARRAAPGWDRPGFDDSAWSPALVVPGPGGVLRGFSHAAPTLTTHENLVPVATRALTPTTTVYDLGQNTALIPTLRVHGPAGATVKIRPAELVRDDGSIDTASIGTGKKEAAWNYTLAGDPTGESWAPEFFYHGGRYLQVEVSAPAGQPLPVVDAITGRVFSSSAAAIGHFATANPLLNQIRDLVRWAQRSNLMSVLTDCPHRERLGWMEQYHLNGPALRCEWDLTRLYRKTFQDMVDAQQANGLVPSIAPEYVRFEGYFRDSPEWGSALILAPAQQLTWSGDDTPLREHYAAMQRYFAFLQARTNRDGLVTHGLGDWYDLGPERPGVAQLTPIPLVATATTYEDALALAAMAHHLDRPAEARNYEAATTTIGRAFNAAFLDRATGIYATGSQTAQAMPLVLGLVPGEQRSGTLQHLLDAVLAAGHATTAGDVGHRYFLNALADTGHSDVVYGIINQTAHPGYGYQITHGATALTEAWDADRRSSNNHFMLGHILEWFYGHLAGLAPDPAYPGFARASIRPEPVDNLAWAEAAIDTVRGPFAVRWERDPNGHELTVHVTVPANATASVQLPLAAGSTAATITESGQPVADAVGVTAQGDIAGRPAFLVGSGTYVFRTAL